MSASASQDELASVNIVGAVLDIQNAAQEIRRILEKHPVERLKLELNKHKSAHTEVCSQCGRAPGFWSADGTKFCSNICRRDNQLKKHFAQMLEKVRKGLG